MTFVQSEQDLLALIRAEIPGYTEDNCVAGQADQAFTCAAENSSDLCVTDYNGGMSDRQPSPVGKADLWVHSIAVSFFLDFDPATIETKIRTLTDNFLKLRRDHKVLASGGLWSIQSARPFAVLKHSDRTFVPVNFVVNVKEPV